MSGELVRRLSRSQQHRVLPYVGVEHFLALDVRRADHLGHDGQEPGHCHGSHAGGFGAGALGQRQQQRRRWVVAEVGGKLERIGRCESVGEQRRGRQRVPVG